jgi:hypothetical protein
MPPVLEIRSNTSFCDEVRSSCLKAPPLIRPTEAPQARLPNPNHDSNEQQADGPQNLMKGYIARERGIVVLSKGGAFPGTGV